MVQGFVPVIHAGSDDRPDEADTVFAAWSVASALNKLGYQSEIIQIGLDLGALETLASRKPLCVFNLVEAIRGDDRLAGVAVSVLEHLGMPFTGGGAEAFASTLSKCLSKKILQAAGVPCPVGSDDGTDCPPALQFIVKSDALHGSQGMDDKSVVKGADAAQEIASRSQRFGGRFFCEQYIEGREFNVAVMGEGEDVQCLPIQEIDFTGFPEGRPKIVDYAAKWDGNDTAYHTTNRRFGLEKTEPALAEKLQHLSLLAWRTLALNGYARVDFRVDGAGNPFVLEVNVNPAIAPDAGFPAAAREAGMDYTQMTQKILMTAINKQKGVVGTSENLTNLKNETTAIVKKSDTTAEVSAITWRDAVKNSDIDDICTLVRATGFFNEAEVAIAGELVEERLSKGPASGYEFIIAEQNGKVVGYACFGKIDGTEASFDLYWIAVSPDCQRQGLGRKVMRKAEEIMYGTGAGLIYVETSSSDKYRVTRAFYESMGYFEKARLDDFYKKGDGKVIFVGECVAPSERH
ncbi:MAG: GNAT family N-acetyltransferase [Rhodospirillales bacterium]|nr:GNAT family N-acetyltransferase [Rhodospirillales bacterium]